MSLPQKKGNLPRSEAEAEVFKRGLTVMGLFYASINGVTVLQRKDIVLPPGAVGANYNTRPYSDRGWPIFEEGVAKVVAAHLEAAAARGPLPASLTCVRAKMIHIDGDIALPYETKVNPWQHLREVQLVISTIHFTGKGDRKEIQGMLAELEWIIKVAFDEVLEGGGGDAARPKIRAAMSATKLLGTAVARSDHLEREHTTGCSCGPLGAVAPTAEPC